MIKSYLGDYINVEKLEEYPVKSQKLMQLIADNMPYKTKKLEGSYSILNKDNITVVKILCTHFANLMIYDEGVAVLFRYEYLKNNLKKVNEKYKLLGIESDVVAAGSADNIEPFYYTRIENSEIFNIKKQDIINLTGKLLGF